MDLAGRRIKQDFEDRRLPELREKIAAYCPGSSISYEIDWDSFEGDQDALESLWIVFEQGSYALEEVCKDQLGREAAAEAVHRVVIKNVKADSEVGATFEAGTLTMAIHCAEGSTGGPGVAAAAKIITAGL
jgi:hypothetical protein